MSRQHTKKYTCRKCNKEFDITIWDRVNTILEPEMKEKVLNGEIFKVVCPHCGHTTFIIYPMMYYQIEDQFAVFLDPYNINNIERKLKIQCCFNDNDIYQKTTIRVVSSYNELKEKIYIFDHHLDDRVIEILKFMIYSKLKKEDPDMDIIEILLGSNDEHHHLFYVSTSDGKWTNVEFDEDMYETMCIDYETDIQEDNEILIDIDWALHVINRPHMAN